MLLNKLDEQLYNHFETNGMGDMLFVHRCAAIIDCHCEWSLKFSAMDCGAGEIHAREISKSRA